MYLPNTTCRISVRRSAVHAQRALCRRALSGWAGAARAAKSAVQQAEDMATQRSASNTAALFHAWRSWALYRQHLQRSEGLLAARHTARILRRAVDAWLGETSGASARKAAVAAMCSRRTQQLHAGIMDAWQQQARSGVKVNARMGRMRSRQQRRLLWEVMDAWRQEAVTSRGLWSLTVTMDGRQVCSSCPACVQRAAQVPLRRTFQAWRLRAARNRRLVQAALTASRSLRHVRQRAVLGAWRGVVGNSQSKVLQAQQAQMSRITASVFAVWRHQAAQSAALEHLGTELFNAVMARAAAAVFYSWRMQVGQKSRHATVFRTLAEVRKQRLVSQSFKSWARVAQTKRRQDQQVLEVQHRALQRVVKALIRAWVAWAARGAAANRMSAARRKSFMVRLLRSWHRAATRERLLEQVVQGRLRALEHRVQRLAFSAWWQLTCDLGDGDGDLGQVQMAALMRHGQGWNPAAAATAASAPGQHAFGMRSWMSHMAPAVMQARRLRATLRAWRAWAAWRAHSNLLVLHAVLRARRRLLGACFAAWKVQLAAAHAAGLLASRHARLSARRVLMRVMDEWRGAVFRSRRVMHMWEQRVATRTWVHLGKCLEAWRMLAAVQVAARRQAEVIGLRARQRIQRDTLRRWAELIGLLKHCRAQATARGADKVHHQVSAGEGCRQLPLPEAHRHPCQAV